MTNSSRLPRIIQPDDPERYRGLPQKEQRRLLEKKCRALEGRGLRVTRSCASALGSGLPPWRVLPLLDALLKCPCCERGIRCNKSISHA